MYIDLFLPRPATQYTSTMRLLYWIEGKCIAQPGFPTHPSSPTQDIKLKSLLSFPQPSSGISIMFYHPLDLAQQDRETECNNLQIHV